MVTESKKAQKVKIVKCAVCSESFENKILETYQSSNIKCPKCKSYFLPKSQEQSKIGKYEKKNKKSSKLIKFFNARTGTDEKPYETGYYNILNVSPSATQKDIKMAYQILELKYNSGYDQDDQENKEIFENISKAYQVLSDPEKRSEYNKYGKTDNYNLRELSKQQFGGDSFNEYIGDLILEVTDLLDEDLNSEISDSFNISDIEKKEERSERQENRINELTEKLLEKTRNHTEYVKPYFNNSEELKEKEEESIVNFKNNIYIEADNLKCQGHGIELLCTISYVYKSMANQALNQFKINNGAIHQKIYSYMNNITGTLQKKKHLFSNLNKSSMYSTKFKESCEKIQNQKKMNRFNETLTEENKQKLIDPLREEASIAFLNTFWQSAKLIIEDTLIDVCNKLFSDATVDPIEIKERAMAVLAIGEVFGEVSNMNKIIQSPDTHPISESVYDNSDFKDWVIV
jgi:curved DNA-binding protein CbpA/DNA-directed RNA polymerase subunit RPC12/RpoP